METRPRPCDIPDANVAVCDEPVEDLEKNIVDWQPNYDQTREEPLVLPSKFPNLLANGTEGIAVGMAAKISPHNLGELCDGFAYSSPTPRPVSREWIESVKGPDFPTSA